MKKIIALVLCLVMTLCALTACGPKGKTLDEVKAEGKLVIATSPDFPPFENLEGNEVVGIEIDIMKLVCKELGVELVIETMDFDSVLVGIPAAKYDCGVSGITVTPDREKNMRFTTPYYVAAQCIVVKDGSSIKGVADLEGKKVSVQTATTAEDACLKAGYDVKSFQNNADAKTALTTDKVDAWVVDNLTALQMVNDNDGLTILEEELTQEPYAFAFAYGSETLVAAIDEVLKKLIADGTIEEIFTAWGEDYVAPKN